MMKKNPVAKAATGALIALLLPLSAFAQPVDMEGLDLTLEVLGADELVNDQIVNRIEIPGILPGAGDALAGRDQPVAQIVNGVKGTVESTVSGVGNVVEGVLESLGNSGARDR